MLTLDGSISPYLPTKEILDAIDATSPIERSVETLSRMLRERLALMHGVSPERIALLPHDERRFDRLALLYPASPWVTYPPVDAGAGGLASVREIVTIERSDGFRIEEPQIAATPRNSLALVVSPNDPTGTALGAATAAQLVRRVSLLVVDDRSAEIQRRSMIRLVEEFDSIVLLRSFADWAGLGENAPGYAIASPQIAQSIDRAGELNAQGLHAAMAAVSNASKLDAIAQRVRLERMRLYRMLRKLNLVIPYPSDAGYILAHVTRGDRDAIAAALLERDIAVYSPTQTRLATTLRFSAISPAATRQLQAALIDIGRTVLD